jgi:hypothetical protein
VGRVHALLIRHEGDRLLPCTDENWGFLKSHYGTRRGEFSDLSSSLITNCWSYERFTWMITVDIVKEDWMDLTLGGLNMESTLAESRELRDAREYLLAMGRPRCLKMSLWRFDDTRMRNKALRARNKTATSSLDILNSGLLLLTARYWLWYSFKHDLNVFHQNIWRPESVALVHNLMN